MMHFIYYSTNICTEYFKHAAHSPFFFSSKCCIFHNATFFGSCVIHILYTDVLKLKKKKFWRQRVKHDFEAQAYPEVFVIFTAEDGEQYSS